MGDDLTNEPTLAKYLALTHLYRKSKGDGVTPDL